MIEMGRISPDCEQFELEVHKRLCSAYPDYFRCFCVECDIDKRVDVSYTMSNAIYRCRVDHSGSIPLAVCKDSMCPETATLLFSDFVEFLSMWNSMHERLDRHRVLQCEK